MSINAVFLEAYSNARNYIENTFGKAPEDYNILIFEDPALYNSVLLQTNTAGSPRSIVSSNELEILQELKDEDFTPSGIDLFFGSRNPKIFLSSTRLSDDESGKIVEAKLIQLMGKALLVEETTSKFPDTLQKLYKLDTIVYNLFSNNVYEFIRERNAAWVWQYFQDFTASLRLLGLYGLDHFYVPPNSIKQASVFYNYLSEIHAIIQDRSKVVTKAPLFDLILHGFGDLVVNSYLASTTKKTQEFLVPHLKSNLGQPLGVIGNRFLQSDNQSLEQTFNEIVKLQNDQDLTKIWNRKDTKYNLELIRDDLSKQAIIWHSSKNSYWSDLWPLRANQFDKIGTYVGKLQRRGYKTFSELLKDSPLVTEHGTVQLKDREVSVLAIQEDTIGQEQLLILRNHLQAKKDTFLTPLPGLPDVIVFKKFAGMHVASYLGVADTYTPKSYPKSPYDLPLVVRAVQVSKRKDAYVSAARGDEGKIEEANYDNLKSLTEPQHRSIRYLIRQSEVVQ